MHVVLISEDFPPRTLKSGEGTYTRALARSLVRLGHNVSVLAPATDSPFEEDDEGVRVHWFVPWGRNLISPHRVILLRNVAAVHLLLRKINRETPIDVVEIAYQDAWLAITTALGSYPVLARGHGTLEQAWILENQPIEGRQARMVCALDAFVLRHSDLVVTISVFLQNQYRDLYTLPLDQVVVQPLPLSAPDIFLEAASAPNAPLHESKDTVVFLYAGRPNWRKRTHLAVKALARAKVPNKRLVIIGPDTNSAPGGGSMRAYCVELAKELGVADYVEILEGVTQEELFAYYLAADVLVMPSLFENPCLAYLEAMATGLPVIGTTGGGTPEVLTPGVGLIVPPDDVEALAAAMETLGTQPSLRRTLGEAGRRLVATEYTVEKHVQGMLRWYDLTIERNRARHLRSRLLRLISRPRLGASKTWGRTKR